MDAGGHDLSGFKDAMIVLAVAAVAVPALERFKVSPVLTYLVAGALLGPFALGGLAQSLPALGWVTVGNPDALGLAAELGVVFLLFIVGLELSLKRLVTMRRLVFGLGFLQVAIAALGIGFVARMLDSPRPEATVIGLALALSSTAIVVEVLASQQRLATATGRTSFAILLFQDLAVVPVILLVAILGQGGEASVMSGVVQALGTAGIAIALIVAAGLLVLRPLFRLVGSSDNSELFVAAALFVAVGSGLATAAAGLSMALGAFLAGLLLAETEYRRAIEQVIEPFKGLLLGVFFFAAGMKIDLAAIADHPGAVIAGVAGLIAFKAAVVAALMHLFGFPAPPAIKSGLLLGPGGEFAFILVAMAAAARIVSPDAASYALLVTSLSMALIPVLDWMGRRIAAPLEARATVPDAALSLLPAEEEKPSAIVIGHGRVGELVSEMLTTHGISHVVTERTPGLVSAARREGRPVYYGDGRNVDFLMKCGLSHAKAVIITMHTWKEIDELVAAVRSVRPKVVIVSRARDAEHARHLYELGVTDAVPETIEASLQLSEAALVGLGVPTGPVIASIHEKRDEFRHALQKAAKSAGREKTHGLRAKAGTLKPPAP